MYKWAVKTESVSPQSIPTSPLNWCTFSLCKTRKSARAFKMSQKEIWGACKEVKITIHKVKVGETTGTTMIGEKVYS